jgi:hypothetical protein
MRPDRRAGRFAAALLAGFVLGGCATDPRPGPAEGLTASGVRTILGDIERDANALRLDTLRAVLAPDAEISMRTAATGRPQTLRFSSEEYLAQSEAVLEDLRAGGVRYESRSTPPQLRLAPDGRSCTATATTRDTYRHADGRRVETSSRSIVRFVLRDGAPSIESIEVYDETPSVDSSPPAAP